MERLSEVNAALIRQVCQSLEIKTKITDSRIYELAESKSERLWAFACNWASMNIFPDPPPKTILMRV